MRPLPRIYAEVGSAGSSLLPGAAESFAAVRARRHHPRDHREVRADAHHCLRHVGLAAHHVVGWRHGPQKAETLREHGAHVYVGDTLPDIHAAVAAGAHAVGVATGPVPAEELRSGGADVVFESLVGFPDWLTTLD